MPHSPPFLYLSAKMYNASVLSNIRCLDATPEGLDNNDIIYRNTMYSSAEERWVRIG